MNNIKELTIKIEGQKWADANEQAFANVSKKIKIDGFRQGKAPKDVIKKKVKEESLFLDAADIVLQDAYMEVMEANKDLEIVAQPEIGVKNISKDGVEFSITLTLKPEVKIKKYKKLGVEKESTEVTKEEIEKTISEMQAKYAETVNKTEGAVAVGDTAVIDFEGFKDDIAFAGGKGENYELKIGSNTFIPGFEDQVVGMELNSEKEINVTFPEDYHSEDLKGAPVVFKVKVNAIKETVVPELNEEFYADLGIEGVNSLETLTTEIEKMIKDKKEIDSDNKFIDALIDAAIKETEVEIPEVMINEETDRIIKQYEENLKMQGLSLEQFYKFTNSDEAALKEQMREEAVKRVTSRLLLEEIAKVEKIDITDEEANKEAEALAAKYKMELEQFLTMFGGIDMIKYDNKMRRAIDVLKENN